MRNYIYLIEEELGGQTPKQQYDNLIKLKSELIHYKSKRDHAVMNLKAIADTEAVDSTVRNLCKIVADICAEDHAN